MPTEPKTKKIPKTNQNKYPPPQARTVRGSVGPLVRTPLLEVSSDGCRLRPTNCIRGPAIEQASERQQRWRDLLQFVQERCPGDAVVRATPI